MKIRSIIATATFALTAVQAAAAAPFSGDEPFICASLIVRSCDTSGNCSSETADSVNLPEFLKLDVAGQKITGTKPDGEALVAAIDSVYHVEGIMTLQGMQGHIAWSVMIAEATGDMTLIAAGDGNGYVVFGACTLR